MTKNDVNNSMKVGDGSLDDLVFANRNKEYGAYVLRKKYSKYVLLSFLIAIFILAGAIAKPIYDAYMLKGKKSTKMEKDVSMELKDLTQEEAPPPPPPPPPPPAIEQQVKFAAPEVVEEVKVETRLATMDEMADATGDIAPPENIQLVETTDKVIEKVEEQGVWFVEEPATFKGGDLASFTQWVLEHTSYPQEASEAGIFGKVIVQFSVNREGRVCDVKVTRSVHPSLDAEAIRVINESPKWKPAKQSGNAVKQNFTIPIQFSLQ
jgi:periplasmic protein TonB